MQTLSRLRETTTTWETLRTRLAELHELAEMIEVEPDAQIESEIQQVVAEIEEELERQRF